MKTIRGTFLLFLAVFASGISAEDKKQTTLEQLVDLTAKNEAMLRQTIKGASFPLNASIILNNFKEQIDAIYVHLGPELRFGQMDAKTLAVTITEKSSEGHEAFWREKIASRVWLHIEFKDGSYALIAAQLGPVELAKLKENVQQVERQLYTPFILEGYKEEKVSFTRYNDNHWRLKDAGAVPTSLWDAMLSSNTWVTREKSTVGAVFSAWAPIVIAPSFLAADIDKLLKQRGPVRR